MSLNVYAFTCGWLTLPAALLLAGEKGSLTVPVPAYLIEHPKGRAIFDSGLHVDTQTDPNRRLGRLASYHTVGFKPGEEIATRLESLGIAPSKIDFIINSHLHFDHCGGNQQLPNATLLIQRREWEAGHNADLIESVFYDPHDYDHGHRVKMIDGEHDVFGDGSVVCIPTPGHTPGHQSLRVRIGGRRSRDDGRRMLPAPHARQLPPANRDVRSRADARIDTPAARATRRRRNDHHGPRPRPVEDYPAGARSARSRPAGGLNFDLLTSSIGLSDRKRSDARM